MNRFEQLIEYVINDEEAKARELFHDIVVEKSHRLEAGLIGIGMLDKFGSQIGEIMRVSHGVNVKS